MRVIILAGGKGVRLAPLTEVIPKPLVPLGGMPIMEVVIRQLAAQGFSRITLAVGYLSELIQAYFQDGSRWGVNIDYSLETEPLGTAGPLAQIPDLTDTFLVMNADILTNLNFRELVDYHRAQGGIATIGAHECQVKIDLGVIIKNGHGRIRDYLEKPTSTHLVSMGVYVFEPEVLKFVEGPRYLDFPDLVKGLLTADKTVGYYLFSGYWLDIGRHEDYSRASQEFDEKKSEFFSIRTKRENSNNRFSSPSPAGNLPHLPSLLPVFFALTSPRNFNPFVKKAVKRAKVGKKPFSYRFIVIPNDVKHLNSLKIRDPLLCST
jgi:NDP-sugar pyrophosphorylase family protein